MNIIQASQLTKSFRSRGNRNIITGIWRPEWKARTAVDGISFEIAEGEAVAFLGPNGAGKTTTTKMMTGLIAPTDGSIRVLGYDPFERDARYLKRIGLVMGNRAGLNWDLSARQSFWLNRHIYGIPESRYQQRVQELTELLDVARHLDTQVRRLSLGERMKLELIGAILHEPEVLFLDEPTIGLDVIAKKNIREFLRQLHDQGQTIILTSHDMDDVEEVCERVIVINQGQLVFDDSLTALTDHYKSDRFIRFVFDKRPSKAELKKLGQILEIGDSDVLIRVDAAKMVQVIAAASSEYKLIDMRVEPVPLEEVITELFQST